MVQLRVVLDQTGSPTAGDDAWVARSLARGLVETAPAGCDVAAIVPNGAEDTMIPGVSEVHRMRLGRRELAAAWQFGVPAGVGAGMIHAPSLLAPLVRHDRVHNHDQTVVTIWDLCAWENTAGLPTSTAAWQRAMLRRAVRHADAVVVPSHAIAARLGEHAAFGDRVRVIAGAAPTGFAVPADATQRREDLLIPDRYVVIVGRGDQLGDGFAAAAAAGLEAVVLDVAEGAEPEVVARGAAAGLSERAVHARGRGEVRDRASVIGGAEALLVAGDGFAWPWRAIEALALGVPVVAVASDVHADVLADGAALVGVDELADALIDAVGDGAQRARVLAADRGRAFSWQGAAERVWALHAEL
ncbi:glycosyltransferase involved in cell wall biosynthesis [Microbacterium keratanolyticum]|nr:glycosyltransferase [Microbacterium keratanolyticum]MBM7467967.1 glycosyltransferase involved in cell wall biosynthesis [Microbacterium keratanolyticum]